VGWCNEATISLPTPHNLRIESKLEQSQSGWNFEQDQQQLGVCKWRGTTKHAPPEKNIKGPLFPPIPVLSSPTAASNLVNFASNLQTSKFSKKLPRFKHKSSSWVAAVVQLLALVAVVLHALVKAAL